MLKTMRMVPTPRFVPLRGRRSLGVAVILVWIGVCAQASSQASSEAANPTPTKPTVLELFTSQGCSSCPPADALLQALAHKPNVIALSFPVDYWDYIGWKDTLATPAFTARQKAYALSRGDGQVYTPQVVIDGTMHAVGSDAAAIARVADMSFGASGAMQVPVSISVQNGRFQIHVGNGQTVPGVDATMPAHVWLLRLVRQASVPIGRGENRGQTITYTHVVRTMTALATWSGGELQFDVPVQEGGDRAAGANGAVVLVQGGSDMHPGVIYGAAMAPEWVGSSPFAEVGSARY